MTSSTGSRRSSRRSDSGARLAGRDDLDLDAVVARESGDADGRPGRWLGREVLAVDGVHPGELVEVAEVHRGLDDVAVAEADGLEEPADVVEHLAGLRLDAARDHLAARAVTDLAGEEDEAVGLDDLAEGERAGDESLAGVDALGHVDLRCGCCGRR